MKMLIIIDNYLPIKTAGAVRIHSFAESLSQSGDYQVTVFGGLKKKPDTTQSDYLPQSHYQIVSISRPEDTNIFVFGFFLLRYYLAGFFKVFSADSILITVPLYELLMLSIPAVILRKKIIIDVRDSLFFIDYKGYLQKKLPHFIADFLAKSISFIIFKLAYFAIKFSAVVTVANQEISNELNTITRNKYSSKIIVVENGISDAFLSQPATNKKLNRPLTFCYIGNYSERDSFTPLYQLLPLLQKPLRVILVGEGRSKKQTVAELTALIGPDSVQDFGTLDHAQIPQLIQAEVDIGFIFRDETSVASIPVSAIEMLALGTPMIVNHLGEMGKFVTEFGGYTISSLEDIKQLADKINTTTLSVPTDKVTALREKYSRKKIAANFVHKLSHFIDT